MPAARKPDRNKVGRNTKARSPIKDCPNKHWVELEHGTEYPDDYGQCEMAANTPFRITFGDGSQARGKLNEQGFARFDGIPEGEVRVEYEPDIDRKLVELKQQLRQALDEIVQAERAEYQRIEKELQSSQILGSNTLAKGVKYTGAALKGLFNGAVGLVTSAWELLKGCGKVLYEVGLRTNPITAPLKFQEDIKYLKEKYQQLKRFADEDLEAYVILMSEPDTYAIFKKFASELLDAQHPLEMTEGGGELAFDVILSIVTGGAGAAANVRHVGKLKKLEPVVDELVDGIKTKKRRKRSDADDPNRKIVTRIQLRRVPCFCPFKNAKFNDLSKENRKKYLQEYDRQLRRQEDAINKMSVDDYLAARKAYTGNDGRHPLSSKMQKAKRIDFEKNLTPPYS